MPKRNNRLKEYFGFIPINPTVNFYEHPCAGTLSNIPKAVQTEEMALLALESEEQYSSPVLRYTSKKLKTDEICDKAVAVNVLNFLYTPQEYRTAERCLDAVRRDTDKIAAEVKRFGGSGYVHGSIVDIDFYNHIYLDPFDGYLMPYFAFDVAGRREFRSVQELLESSPLPALGSDGKPLLSAYTKLLDAGGVSILAPTVKEDALAVVPTEVLDEKDIYSPSRVMKSIQYLLDKGVVRVWNDAVLAMVDKNALPETQQELQKNRT